MNRDCLRTLFFLQITLLTLLLFVPFTALAAPPDLSKHPVYSTYQFNKDGKHIYFGTIPLAVEGIITEVMKHDAILKKNLKDLGFEIVFYPFHKGLDAMFFVRRGDIDMGTAGVVQTMSGAATGDVQISGLTKVSSAALIAKKGVVNVSSLKGKRIGYPEGSTAQLGLLTALSMSGIKEEDVRMTPMELSDLTAALVENRIEAFSAFEPTPTAALAKHKDFVSIHRFSSAGHFYQSRRFAEKNPAASLQLHASFVRSLRWMKKSEENLKKATQWTVLANEGFSGKKSEITAAQLMAVVKSDILKFADLPLISEADFKKGGFLHKSFELLNAQGKMPSGATWENIVKSVNGRIIKDILVNPKKYQLDSYRPE